ncbi:class I SAM-dependent methyltransferase [Telluribacter sp.]|uniref:class I SAM-dependent methyltransferase n=1 Tax=Telluribacter sp. TaxID=1978767 RepID=UPI002E0E7AFF|nr:methyltransferase domain-containing protein [Telluribacter sp.]
MDANSYDRIAQEYRDSKQLDFRKQIEEYTLFKLAGDLTGLRVLDLACGEGIYSRKLKLKGAKEVVGVDLSAEMIALADDSERAEPLGCRYLVHDVLDLDLGEQYDVVVGMYLLNYARSREELNQFCQVVYTHLKPGGRYIGFNDNPMNSPLFYGTYRKYGFVKETPKERKEGDFIKYRMFNPDGTEFSFDNFFLPAPTYAEAFAAAGLRDFQWEGPFLNPQESLPEKQSYWTEFMNQPPMIGFSARR